MRRSILYFLTGVATGITTGYAILGATAAAPVSLPEFVGLGGSGVLLLAALVARAKRRAAAGLALVGVAGVWVAYLPAVWAIAPVHWTDQQLSLTVAFWTPSSLPLTVSQGGNPHVILSDAEMARLRNIGLTGSIYLDGVRFFGSGERSAAMLIFQGPVRTKVYLPEPDSTSVVFVQRDDAWTMYPPDARTLSP